MCGIVGVISKTKNGIIQQEKSIFAQLLYAGQLRGNDGTGVFFNVEEDIRYSKTSMKSSSFLGSKRYKALEKEIESCSFIVGHNRAATRGNIDDESSHPFVEENICLVHNGTLFNHKNLCDKTEIDSHAITKSIHKIGVEKTIEKINGAYALVWANNKDKTLNFCRNFQRPLFVVETNLCYFIVSELDMAKWILGRNKTTILKEWEVPTNTLHTIHYNAISNFTIETKEFPIYKYNCPVQLNVYKDWNNQHQNQSSTYSNSSIKHKGQRVYFQTSSNTLLENATLLLEGDLFDEKANTFEDEYRLKIVIEKDMLNTVKKFKNKTKLTGIVGESYWKNGTYYYVHQVEMLEDYLIRVNTVKKEVRCTFCDVISVVPLYPIDGCNLCNTCFNEYNQYGVAVGQC